MTNDELRALADALEPMAQAPRFEDFDVPAFCAWVRACADAEPVAWMHDGFMSTDYERVQHDEMRNRSCGFKAKPIIPLYAHPPVTPQTNAKPVDFVAEARKEIASWPKWMQDAARTAAATMPTTQAEPERQPLTDEQIDEIGEPFGYFTYGDAQGDKRRAFVRAIESSHGIGYGKAIEGGPSELRSCTCHPDDNPPAPCAQQYALNECRAAQPERQPVSEPTEAQIEAGARALSTHWHDSQSMSIAREESAIVLRAALAAK